MIALRVPATPAAAAAGSGSETPFSAPCERLNAAFSCLSERPGWDGKVPLEAGTVGTAPLVRNGSSLSKPFGPSSRSARALSISRPSLEGTVRARKTPTRAVSRRVQVGGVAPRAANSPGSRLGSDRAFDDHALMPSR